MATDRLATISAGKESAGARIRLDLVRQEDSKIELFRHLSEFAQVLIEF